MASLTPILTSTPSNPPTYSVGMAETFSWVPVEGAGRPLFARAGYITNLSDLSISLSAGSINVAGVTAVKVLNPVSAVSIINPISSVSITNPVSAVTITAPVTAIVDDQLKNLVTNSNTLLNKLTAQQTLQAVNQDEIITLLNAITATAIEVDLNTDQLELNVSGVEVKQDATNSMLASLTANIGTVPGFKIPAYDKLELSYAAGTSNISQVKYFKSGVNINNVLLGYSTSGLLTSVEKV